MAKVKNTSLKKNTTNYARIPLSYLITNGPTNLNLEKINHQLRPRSRHQKMDKLDKCGEQEHNLWGEKAKRFILFQN